MALKYKLQSRDEAPAEFQGLYVERDGAWVLDVDGAVEKARLEEFRANNVTLMKEREELRQRFEGIDPEEVRKLAEEKRRLEEERQVKAGEMDSVVAGRLRSARAEWEKQMASVVAERDTFKGALAEVRIDQTVIGEATKRGLRASALEDLTARARKVFSLVDGVPRALEADGRTVRVGRDGVAPLSVAEWVEGLVGTAPHLFESNVGGGAAGNGSGGVGNRAGQNPFRKETWNLTAQMQLMRTDPQLAQRLKAAA